MTSTDDPRPLAETLPALRRRLHIADLGEAERQRRRAAAETALHIASEHGLRYEYVRHALAAGVAASDVDAITAYCAAEWEAEAGEARAVQRDVIVAATYERIPVLFAGATASHPGIIGWANTLIREARAKARMPGADYVTTGPSLLITGPVGTGKTYQAYAALRMLADASVHAGWEFWAAADLYASQRPREHGDAETEFRRVRAARVLVLDDIGTGKVSEATEDINYRLLNYRAEHQLPTIFTSNLLPRELPGRLGQRVASRLTEMTTPVPMTGPDRRIRREAA